MEITRNGEQFLISVGGNKAGAVYKDGSLEVSGMMGAITLTYVKASDTVLVPGILGQTEFKRAK